jgi:hypothetical protein
MHINIRNTGGEERQDDKFGNRGKNLTQSLSLLLGNYILILKILPVTRFKEDPKATILTLRMHTGRRL